MPEPTPSRPASDRNLLFGILALQMDFISRDALIAAMSAWVLDKAKSLGEILQGQGALVEADRAALDALVDRHLARHGGDPERSLASVAPGRRRLGPRRAMPARGPRPRRQPRPRRRRPHAERPPRRGRRHRGPHRP